MVLLVENESLNKYRTYEISRERSKSPFNDKENVRSTLIAKIENPKPVV